MIETHMLKSFALAISLAVSAPAIHAQTFELTTGEVVIGTVTAVDASHVSFEAGYPAPTTRKVERQSLVPNSLYQAVRTLAMPKTADDHLGLAGEALTIGLPLHAIAELQAAQKLDKSRATDIARQIKLVRDDVAKGIVDEAQRLHAENRDASAKLHAEVVMQRYGDTPAAKRGKKLVDQINAAMQGAITGKPVSEKVLTKTLADVHKREKKAEKVGVTLTGGFRFTVKEKNKRERAIQELEKAWKALTKVSPGKDVSIATRDSYTSTRERIRDSLGQHYLGIGSVLVQRLALPSAEDYNAKACELDPNSGGCKNLQNLIIEARISRGFGF